MYKFFEAMISSINQRQDEIVDEITALHGDLEATLYYIISCGKALRHMPPEFKRNENIINGCHSKVWLAPFRELNRIYFYAESDTLISKGLAGMLIRIFDGQTVNDILDTDVYFFRMNDLERFIGTKRSSGFSAMHEKIKLLCSAQ